MGTEIKYILHNHEYVFSLDDDDFKRVGRAEKAFKYGDDISMRLALYDEFHKQVYRDGFLGMFGGIKYDWIVKQRRNNRDKVKRCKKRIENMVCTGDAVLLTLTFNDETLSRLNENSRRKAVALFCKEQTLDYVGNVDFGKKNGRVHYHIVCVPKEKNVDFMAWRKYGNINAKRVPCVDDSTALSKYVSKLTAHAFKDTADSAHLLYGRSVDFSKLPF